jgi:hypothetical protein
MDVYGRPSKLQRGVTYFFEQNELVNYLMAAGMDRERAINKATKWAETESRYIPEQVAMAGSIDRFLETRSTSTINALVGHYSGSISSDEMRHMSQIFIQQRAERVVNEFIVAISGDREFGQDYWTQTEINTRADLDTHFNYSENPTQALFRYYNQ